MDLISILWILVGAAALIFSGDALAPYLSSRRRLSSARRRSALSFGVMMFLFSIGTLILVFASRLT
jgi:Ca2+/Na+ antiporter